MADNDWTWEADLDDTDDEGGFGSYEPQKGDVLLLCVENLEMPEGPAGYYSKTTFRIIAGPLNDESRNAGPFISGKDDRLCSLRVWDNLSFSPKARYRLKPFLRAVGHSGPVSLKAPKEKGDLTQEQQFQDLVCDREVKVIIDVEEDNNGKPRMVVDEYLRLSASDWQFVEKAYSDFGPARGMLWMPADKRPEGVTPIQEWKGAPAAAPGNDMGNASF